jgi:hypothetical protein
VDKQGHSVLFFQKPDMLGYSGLGQVQLLGGPGKIHGLANT